MPGQGDDVLSLSVTHEGCLQALSPAPLCLPSAEPLGPVMVADCRWEPGALQRFRPGRTGGWGFLEEGRGDRQVAEGRA